MPKIDFTAMPAVELRNFCRTFSAAIKRSTEDPAFVEAFNNRHRVGKEVETLSENSNLHSSGNSIDSDLDIRSDNGFGEQQEQCGERYDDGGYTTEVNPCCNASPVRP